MDTVAYLNTKDAAFFSSRVQSILDRKFILQNNLGQVVKAECASSCLIEPCQGDRVLVVFAEGDYFILALLQQQNANLARVNFKGDVELNIPNGFFELFAKEKVQINSLDELNLSAKQLGLAGEVLLSAFKKVNMYSDNAEVHIENVKLFSHMFQSVIQSAFQQFGRRHADVKGLDSTIAQSIKQTASDVMSLKSKFSFIKALKNVKIDGKQILMG